MAIKRKNLEFKCYDCGGNKLAYQTHVKCLAPVEINSSGRLHYGPVVIDASDYLKSSVMFCCRDCGTRLVYNNRGVRTEKKVRAYCKNYSDISYQPRSAAEEQALFDLMDKVEKDGVVIPKSERDK